MRPSPHMTAMVVATGSDPRQLPATTRGHWPHIDHTLRAVGFRLPRTTSDVSEDVRTFTTSRTSDSRNDGLGWTTHRAQYAGRGRGKAPVCAIRRQPNTIATHESRGRTPTTTHDDKICVNDYPGSRMGLLRTRWILTT